MKIFLSLIVCAFCLVVSGCGVDPVDSVMNSPTLSTPQATVTSAGAVVDNVNIKVPLDTVLFNDCTGEDVHFTGVEHLRTHVTINGSTFVASLNVNDQGITGVGLTSGLKYNRTGATHENDVFHGALGTVIVFTNSFDMHSQGSAPNFTIHEVFSLVVNANGEITVSRDKLTITCK